MRVTSQPVTGMERPSEPVMLYIDAACPTRAGLLHDIVIRCLAPQAAAPQLVRTSAELDTRKPASAGNSAGNGAEPGAEGRALILNAAPAVALAVALGQGQPADQAVSDWRIRTEALLAFFRRNRCRAVIAEDTAFLADPLGTLARAGLEVADRIPDALPALPAPPDAVLQLMGAELLRRDPLATALAGELAASAAIALPGQPPADLDTARRLYAGALEETARLSGAQADSRARIAALEAELAERARAERESPEAALSTACSTETGLRNDIARLQAQILQLRQGLDSTTAQLQDEKSGHARVARENRDLQTRVGDLSAQLDTRQRAFERAQAEIASLQAALELQATELEVFTDTLAALQEQRQTDRHMHAEALESARRALDDKADRLAARDAEIEMLTAALAARQAEQRAERASHAEALEGARRALDDSTGRLNASEAELESLRARLAALSDRLAARDTEAAALRADLEARSAEMADLHRRLAERDADLARLYGSHSYRLTAPLRWLRHAMRPKR